MNEPRWPLCWPQGWPRAKSRIRAKFTRTERTEFGSRPSGSISIAEGVERVLRELQRLGISDRDAVISTNVYPRLDGLPRGSSSSPQDPGVAVYWTHKKRRECMAIDRYDRVADNLAAVAATLYAMRAIERHGGAQILERAFTGFAALPERAGGRGWREILGFPHLTTPTESMVKDHFQERAKVAHPDKPTGDRDSFEELVWARDAALKELTHQ